MSVVAWISGCDAKATPETPQPGEHTLHRLPLNPELHCTSVYMRLVGFVASTHKEQFRLASSSGASTAWYHAV